MKLAVRYYTRSGNTRKLAQAIAQAVDAEALDVSVPLDEPVDILFLGSSYYAFDVDDAVKRFLAENKDRIGTVYNFGTAAMLNSTRKSVEKAAKEHGITVAQAEFHCRGSFGIAHKGRPNEADCRAAADFARQIADKG